MDKISFNPVEMIALELYSVKVELQARDTRGISTIQGNHTYAAFLNLLRASSSSLAEELHNLEGPKPFTVSLLQRKPAKTKADLEKTGQTGYSLRLTFLEGPIFAHFLDGALKWGERDVQVGAALFKIDRIDTLGAGLPAAPFKSYGDILNSASNDRQIVLEFLSPTVFRSGGKRNVIFPEPLLVFGSLLNRWQAFSPIKLDDSISSWLEGVLVARYRLTTRMLDFGTYREVGFTGHCQYEIDKRNPEDVVTTLNALADFASFAGTGAKTTMGMGQTRRVNIRKRTLTTE